MALLLEEPYGTFGAMNPTGHAAVYLSNVCAASPVELRRCEPGEHGVVISRYHRVAGYDWLAMPLIAYLYAVDRPDEVPASVTPASVAALRDAYRRAHFANLVPDADGGAMPKGDWTQVVGSAYDRTIYAFDIETTEDQDDQFIEAYNDRKNTTHFNILFYNCSDFARKVVDFYFPRAVHRSVLADGGIMTPKQAAKSLLSYSKHHKDLQFSVLVIPQVAGTVPRSTAVRGVFESLVKSKKYAVPLVTVAVLHPFVGGSLAFAWIDSERFDPKRLVSKEIVSAQPAAIENELESNHVIKISTDTAVDQPRR